MTIHVNTTLAKLIMANYPQRPARWPNELHTQGIAVDWDNLHTATGVKPPTMTKCQALGVTCFCVPIPAKKIPEKLA